MVGQIPSWLETAGQAAAAAMAVVALLAALGRSRLGRWLWRRLVHDPATDWLRRNTEAVVAPVAEALVHHMDDEVELRKIDAEERRRAQDEQRVWRDQVERQLAAGAEQFIELREDVARIGGKLDAALAGNPEVRRG